MTALSSPESGVLSPEFRAARSSFGDTRGYLSAASTGLPPLAAIDALTEDLRVSAGARRDPRYYDGVVERTRALYAGIVGVATGRVAQGSQTSVMASVVAAAVPAGAEILCVDGDFSSMVFPFLQRRDVSVRHVPAHALAHEVSDTTWLVAFSLVQSSTGFVVDGAGIAAAAARHGAFTFCDTTQAIGVLPVDATLFDATVCHTYKWLCAPRGVAFLTLSMEFQEHLAPVQAGWYAGDDVWQSCYGPDMHLSADARAFDVSPAWPSWVGAEHSIGLFAGFDIAEVWRYTTRLGDLLCEGLGIDPQHQAIVTWADADGQDLRRLEEADIRAAGRAGRLRASFHLWNDEEDVAGVLRALR